MEGSSSAEGQQPVTVVASVFEDLVAVGLRELLRADSNLELIAGDVPLERMEAALHELSPAVVVLNFGSLPTPAAVYQLHQAAPETRIVVLANRPTAAECNQMLSFGATACISKETQARDIVNAIHLASRGMHVLPRSAALRGPGERADIGGAALLTPREADVLELLQEGRSNGQIAHALSIGIETVRTHARNIYRKLGVGSRRELATLSRNGAAPVAAMPAPVAAAPAPTAPEPANVALVRRIYAAWRAHGTPVESGLLDPEIEFVNPPDAIEPGTRRGIAEFEQAVRHINELMDGYRVEAERLVEAGEEVVVIGTIHARGRGSGAEIRRRHGYVWTLRDGRAIRFRWFSEPDDALRAVGLEP